ncbi:hypothetical protein V8G61_08900 [Gaetbulibacter sp. M240]|uniref:type II toxin-antitoxin system HicB family antitoxin n=1 Tax=Gaetbulibacter sp. M240 TaxID=3126511 RepID=UPI00374F60FC
MKTKLTAVIEKTGTGFSGYIKELNGIATTGDTISEIKEDFILALELKGIENYEIDYVIDLEQFFSYFKVINKSAFAEYIGMNKSLFRQYTGSLTKLSDDKLLDITKGLHNLANDFSNIVLVR